jgi:hypothetical protein
MSETSTVTGNEPFDMPQATAGLPILWYPLGQHDRTNCMVAYMIHCGHRTAVILTSTGQRRDAVRHLSDPKLKLSDDQRENGAWDFTEEYKRVKEMEKTFLDRMDLIEQRIGILFAKLQDQEDKPSNGERAKRGRPKKTESNTDSEMAHKARERFRIYREKLQRAVALNLPISQRPKMAELEEALAAAENASEQPAPTEASEALSPTVTHEE